MQVTYGKGFAPIAAPTMRQKVDHLEREFLKLPQVECSVVHRFGPGIYIREVTVPAGSLAIGHHQKAEHLNVFLRGRVLIVNDDGTSTELVAPMTFVGQPGRKIGHIVEDMVWQNIYATTETDIAKLEATFLDKSEGWTDSRVPLQIANGADQSDYHAMLAEYGFDESTARAQSESETDQIAFPHGGYKCMVSASKIEGRGLFATASLADGEVIAPARINGMRTPAGRYTNHSANPNARMVMLPSGDIEITATRPIKGCTGGDLGEEITIDYREALSLQITKEGTP